MKRHVWTLLFVLGLGLVPLSAQEGPFFRDGEAALRAREIAAELSDEECLSQMLVLSFVGQSLDPRLPRWIAARGLGGVYLSGWNAGSLEALTATVTRLQAEALGSRQAVPLFVTTDQEGGFVRHIEAGTSETTGNLALGASGLPDDAYRSGLYIGRELAALGINMDLAPSVDIYQNRDNVITVQRSFGNSAERVAELGAAFARGLEDSGVVAVAKHFPGHGATETDSHTGLPRIDIDLETLLSRELLPFRRLVREGVPALMTGHIAFPRITGTDEPASLSSMMTTRFIRRELGFDGIVITDSLSMGGVAATGLALPAIFEQAIRAGNDMLLYLRALEPDDEIWLRLTGLLRTDPAFRARVRESAERILRVKLRYLRSPFAASFAPSAASAGASLRTPETEDFFFQQACRAATMLRRGSLPYRPTPTGRVLLAGRDDGFFAAGLARLPGARRLELSDPASSGYNPVLDRLRLAEATLDADLVVFRLQYPGDTAVLNSLQSSGVRTVVVSVGNPAYIEQSAWVREAFAVFGVTPACYEAAFAVLLGDFEPRGVSPVEVR